MKPVRITWEKETAVAVLLILGVVMTRLPTFCRSVLDWDESLYFLMAAQWRAGHLPYTTIWDNKPVGIYAIFALFQAIFGFHVAAIRIATICFTSVSALLVVRISGLVAAPRRPAWLAGICFVVGSLSNDGLAANTEIFMASFTAGAVLLALTPAHHLRRAFAAGVLMGLAFMVKYVAVFEDPAILLLLLVRARGRDAAGVIAACITGAALPLAVVILLYAQAGQLPLWWSDSVASNFRRVATGVPPGALGYAIRTEFLRWGDYFAAAFLLAGAAAISGIHAARARCLTREQADLLFVTLWLLGGCIGVASSKSFYDHYFLQILAPLCVSVGWVAWRMAPFYGNAIKCFLVVLVLAQPTFAALTALHDLLDPVLVVSERGIVLRPDIPAQIAADLREPLAAATHLRIYVFDSEPIIYALTGQTPPTKYVLPSVLTRNFLANVAGINATAEVARILAGKPTFIICRHIPTASAQTLNPAVYATFSAALAANYQLWRQYAGVDVYVLSPER